MVRYGNIQTYEVIARSEFIECANLLDPAQTSGQTSAPDVVRAICGRFSIDTRWW